MLLSSKIVKGATLEVIAGAPHGWLQGMIAGHKAVYDCIKAFSATDFTEDLKKIDVPTLLLHGDDDQIVPIGAAALGHLLHILD